MIKKNKPLPIKKAKEYSRKGHIERTNTVKNSCINTLNRFIESAGEAGETTTGTWFKNTSGFLTPTVIAEIVESFKEVGYAVEVTKSDEHRDFYAEYYIKVSWGLENKACDK